MEELREMEAAGHLEILVGQFEIQDLAGDRVNTTINGKEYTFDCIMNACGHAPKCQQLPVIQELLKEAPVEVVGGLPELTQDLQWGDYEQLFVIGALASLEVGPDAGNLMGLRRAAEIVAQTMGARDWMKETETVLGNVRGNRFAAFADSDSESTGEASDESSRSDSETDKEGYVIA